MSFYGAGLRIYNISKPSRPKLLDQFDTAKEGQGLGAGFNGAFGVYPFSQSGLIYVSDIDNGLYIFSIDLN